jgi:hypothetical protein
MSNGRPADLKNVRLKLARAKEDLDALSAKVAEYMEPRPFHVATEKNGHEQIGRIYIDREPDPEWGLDLGEIAVQARSALDLLVKQLVRDSGNEPTRGNTFPIFLDHDDYLGKGNAKSFREKTLKGVAKRHRTVIDQYQPYHRGKHAGRDPLAILAAIANRDKHEDIHAALGMIVGSKFRLTKPDGTVLELEMTKTDHAPYRIIKDGMELLGLINEPSPDEPDAKVDLDVADVDTQVVFVGDDFITLDDVERSVQRVAVITGHFEKRLQASGKG